jgi:hypothetical protein
LINSLEAQEESIMTKELELVKATTGLKGARGRAIIPSILDDALDILTMGIPIY